MEEIPGGSSGDQQSHDDEGQLPQEPPPRAELPFGGEEPTGAHETTGEPEPPAEEPAESGDSDDAGDEHAAEAGEEEHHTVEHAVEGDAPAATGGEEEPSPDDDEFEYDYHSFDDTDYESLEEHVHSPEELRERRFEERAARRRAGRQRLAALIAAIAAVVVIIVVATSGGGTPPQPPAPLSPIGVTASGPSFLSAGSASALPAGTNILIADRNNSRILSVTPLGQPVWSHRTDSPSDAYPSSTARRIVVTQHLGSQVYVLSVSRQVATYHYGHPHQSGTGANRLHDPSTGQLLPDGRIVIADKANCRVLLVRMPSHHDVTQYGNPSSCVHKPPTSFGSPDGAFPTSDGGLVVTEESPAWVDLLDKQGKLVKQLQVKGLTTPYEANQTPKGDYIATNYAHPGSVVEFDSSGAVKWSYGPTSGHGELYFPTLAIMLTNGNVLITDARNDRVIVVDPSTDQIVWQYGHLAKPGTGAGFLHTPDSAVPVPVAAN